LFQAESLLLFVVFATIFCVFSPKLACQVPKTLKLNKQKKIGFEV
jgi:hypothetical protein